MLEETHNHRGIVDQAISVRRLPHRGQASTSSRCQNDTPKPNASPASGTPRTRVSRKPRLVESPVAYVFGNPVGERIGSIKTAG